MAHAIPIALTAAAGVTKAAGTIIGAKGESKALKSEAKQLEAKAGRTRASSQREAIEQRRQADLLNSRTLALAAASGAGVDDPTVLNIMADIAGEGAYRFMTSLYEGEEEARGLEIAADARRKEAKNVKKAAKFSALGTIIGAGSSMFGQASSMKSKYG